MPIIWKKDYELGIKEIDAQHQHFVGLINRLLETIDKHEKLEELSGIKDDLYNYAVTHFETEEKYFSLFSYEGASEHKLEHIKLLARAKEFKDDKASEPWSSAFKLCDFLEDWLVDHLAQMDRRYVECFHEHGLY